VTFTATVAITSPGGGTPTGNVDFYDGSVVPADLVHTGLVGGSGPFTATYTNTGLSLGSHTIYAVYDGDTNFVGSTTAIPASQTVIQASTRTTVATSGSPIVYGQSVTFTATVAITSPGAGTPTGNVGFYDGSVAPGNLLFTTSLSALAPYTATFATTGLSAGNHTIIAVYQGDTNFVTSTSSGVSERVNQASTSTTVITSGSPSNYGQSVSFTATVAVTGLGVGTPTGSVHFYDGSVAPGNLLGTQTLSVISPFTATYSTSSLSGGAHSIYAVYAGDTNFATSTSVVPASQVVNTVNTTTALSSSSNPSNAGQKIKLIATVTGPNPGIGTPTGTVNFFDGSSTLIGTSTLSGGIAEYTTSTLSSGVHSISAVYAGDADFATSMSNIEYQAVNAVTATIAVVSNRNPSIWGQSVTFKAALSGSAGTPTGTVAFYADGTQIGAVQTLSSGAASISTSSLWAGSHTITVQYSGDGFYNSGTGSLSGGQTVNNTPGITAATTVVSNHNPATYGQSVTFTATVSGSSGTPTGTVTFFSDGTQIGTAQTLISGHAGISTSSLPAGSHTITVQYGGNGTYASGIGVLTGGQVVTSPEISTSIKLLSSLNPSVLGQSVTFTASVVSSSSATPTGTVSFYDGVNLLGAVTLSGLATYTTSRLSVGSHAITAVYSGDTTFAGTTSRALTQVVNAPAGPNVSFASSIVSASFDQGEKPSATVRVGRPGEAIPSTRLFFLVKHRPVRGGSLSTTLTRNTPGAALNMLGRGPARQDLSARRGQ